MIVVGGDGSVEETFCGYSIEPRHFDPCTDPVPGTTIELVGESYELNTDTGVLTPSPGVEIASSEVDGVLVWWTENFTLGSKLRAEGSKPFLIVARESMTIDGVIDVSSLYDGTTASVGAGASLLASTCAAPPEAGVLCDVHGASGGGGGGYGGAGSGGDHGAAARNCGAGVMGRPPTIGGAATTQPTTIRAGCAGAAGSWTNEGVPGDEGLGGPGGGAVHLFAGKSLTVSGTVRAGGAGGGQGKRDRASGGGGGSGGYIGLESETIKLLATAVLAANGGGGGGGTENNDPSPAEPGENGRGDASAAQGGSANPDGSPGNDGGFATTPPEPAADTGDRGGGGGGGGVGWILLQSDNVVPNPDATVTPPGS